MAEANLPVIPETVIVHLGSPGSAGENVTIPFVDYIKNVASSEIYPTWPDASLEANIYAIISYVLNRIYTEWYRSKGYNYDITNDTRYDQAFVPNREIYQNISDIVDNVFNNYIVREGTIQPLFTAFCNGTTSTCAGLSQWGTVDLANQGLSSLDILKRYYGDDINIVNNAPVENIEESYPGDPLQVGEAGNDVKVLQTELNRIGQNYPAIPDIASENGVFGVDTENAVKKFQEIFSLPVTGIVDKSTWYKIKQYYNGVKRLSELVSEGVTLDEASLPFLEVLSEGSQGEQVRVLQYYLSVISYFNPALEPLIINGNYDEATVIAVRDFQQFYGLPVTGILNEATWNEIERIYIETVDSLAPGYQGNRAKFYPGFFLTEGTRNQSVTDLQTYLARIGEAFPQIPVIPITGFFGTQTRDAVYTFQSLFGLPVTGSVGPVTWYRISEEYNALTSTSPV